MKLCPCEQMQWEGLPAIRKEFVRCMVNYYGLPQKEAALKMGLTPAAVSQYLSGKRGNITIYKKQILQEISNSAGKIIQQGESDITTEICKICKLINQK